MERNFFRRRGGGQDIPSLYARPGRTDADFEEADPAHAPRDLERLVDERQEARRAAAGGAAAGDGLRSPAVRGMSLRWVCPHMIAEYSGHCGHADLLRERIAGKTFS